MKHPRRFIGRTAALLCAGLLAGPSEVRADEGDRIMAESLATAKQLAAELPKPAELGAGWLYPWAVPGAAAPEYGAKTEEAWWTAFGQRSFPAGVPAAHAQAMAEASAKAAAGMNTPGFGPREGIIHLRNMIRAQVTTAAQKAADGASMLEAMVTAAPAAGQSGSAAEAMAAQTAMMKALGARYDGMDLEALKKGFVADSTLLAKRTRMDYWSSNDWEQAKLPKPRPGTWVGSVSIVWSFVADGRAGDIVDIDEAGAKRLEAAVNKAYAALHAKTAPAERKRVSESIQRLTEVIDRLATAHPSAHEDASATAGRLAQREGKIAERTAAQQRLEALAGPVTMKVLHRKFGDNSYVMRMSAAVPEAGAGSLSVYTGWLRNGPSLVEITFGGTMPSEEMDKAMDHLLVLMDSKTDVHR